MTLDDLRRRATCTVPEAGQVFGIGRDAAYAAAARGEIPTLHLGRRLVVPVPKLLELLGLPQTNSESAPATDAPIATITDSHMELTHADRSEPASHAARRLRTG